MYHKSLYKERKPTFSWRQSFVVLSNPPSFSLFFPLLYTIVNMRATTCALIAAATLAAAQTGAVPDCMYRQQQHPGHFEC